jgi:hypothetical protein
MMKNYLFLLSVLFLISCGKEDTPPEPTKYNVSITLNPTDGGTVSPNGGQFTEGQSVSFNVTPSENYLFKSWSGSNSTSDNPLKLIIDSNKNLTVNFEKKDTDGDGVTDDVDQCPDTPEGEEVDENGCSDFQKDTDGDGVTDDVDQCPDTPEGEEVDENGCSSTQIDTDGDGVTDDVDQCPDTPEGEEVDENGCSDFQKDTDGDGVTDDVDQCPDTPEGEEVDENGCSDSQKDTDGDGVSDDVDQCPDTPEGEEVDENGCSDSQKDTDGDGVTDNVDQCPDTPEGEEVDESGCIKLVYIPDNFFEDFLMRLGVDDKIDNYVKLSGVLKLTELTIADPNVSDVTGINEFVNLTRLRLRFTSITDINVSKLTKLNFLDIHESKITEIDLSNNSNIKTLTLEGNNIKTFDGSKLEKLELININNNGLETIILDPDINKQMGYIILDNNNLTNLDLSKFYSLGVLSVSNNINLETIKLPDDDQNQELTQVSLENCSLENLSINNLSRLRFLFIRENNLNSIDVSQNTILIDFKVKNNPLTCIKVNETQIDNIPVGWEKDSDDIYSLGCN